jgi:hypothetical protein
MQAASAVAGNMFINMVIAEAARNKAERENAALKELMNLEKESAQ